MLRKWLQRCLVVSALVALGSCGAGPEGGADVLPGESARPVLYPPPVPASGNVLDATAYMGPLELGGAVQTRFTTQPQYLSFSFQVRAGARVKLEVTHLGSSMYLDTGLFVYGPRGAGGYGATVLAQDDDAGYGQLSRVGSLTLAQEGEYLAVVSTGTGAGKQFRLQLDCLNGACAPVVDPALYATCDAGVSARIEACVEGTREEYGASLAEAYSTCTGLDDAHAFYMDVCDASAAAPAWCLGGEVQYSQRMWPVCRDYYQHYYGLYTLSLSSMPVPARLAGDITDINARCGDVCTGALETFTFPWTSTAAPRLDKVAEAALAPGQYAGYTYLGEMTFSQLSDDVAPYWSALPPGLLAELGNGVETVRVAHYALDGTGEWNDLYVILFPQSYRVAVLHTTRRDV
jgi:hypothetical protein